MERTSPADFSHGRHTNFFDTDTRLKPKEAPVKRVLYGAWDTVKKGLESQSPEAWGNRIVNVIDTRIIPKLSLEHQIKYAEMRPKVVQAAEIAGVGITTAEIVGAIVLSKKAIELAQKELDMYRARKSVQWLKTMPDYINRPYPDFPFIEEKVIMPEMPVGRAVSGRYALSPDIRERVYEFYLRDPQETYEMHKTLVKKWTDSGITRDPHVRIWLRSHPIADLERGIEGARKMGKWVPAGENRAALGWMRRRLNGTLVTFANMMEDEAFRFQVNQALKQSEGGELSPEFRSLFEYAHRVAAERFGWKQMGADARHVWGFWNALFDREGLDVFRARAGRQARPGRGVDMAIKTMLKRIEHVPTVYEGFMPDSETIWQNLATNWLVHPPETVVLQKLPGREPVVTGTYIDRIRFNRVLEALLEKTQPHIQTLKEIEESITVRIPEIPEEYRQRARLVWRLIGRAKERRKDQDMLRLAKEFGAATRKQDHVSARLLGKQILERAARGDKELMKEAGLTGDYFKDQEILTNLADVWSRVMEGSGVRSILWALRKKS